MYNDKNSNPAVSDKKVQSGYGKGVYLVQVDKLAVNTKYYSKAYSANTKGAAYGELQNFTTIDYKLPTVSTNVTRSGRSDPQKASFCTSCEQPYLVLASATT